ENIYGVMTGTSMAAPHVTAVVAMMYAYNPGLSTERVLRILKVWDTNRPAGATPAPLVDAFDALVACRDDSLRDLADLDGSGLVVMMAAWEDEARYPRASLPTLLDQR